MLPIKALVTIPFLLCFSWYVNGPAGVQNRSMQEFSVVSAGNISHASELHIYKDENTVALEKMVTPWLLYYTNMYRTEHGLDTLKYDDCLLKAADYHSDYLYNESRKDKEFKLVHQQDPGSKWFKGKSPSDRAATAGCKKYCGENALYFTLPAPQAAEFSNNARLNLMAKKIAKDMVFEHWHKSKGHRDNMLTKAYTSLGVSVAIARSSSGNVYPDDKATETSLKDNGSAGMVVFGVQVLAF